MPASRLLPHLLCPPWRVRRAFPAAAMQAIARAVAAAEQGHSGEIRLAVEGSLEPRALWRGLTARERAVEVFSLLRVWDTAQNNGVLIYVLMAERAVEIVADRGVVAVTAPTVWTDICHTVEAAFAEGRFEAGAVQGIEAVGRVLREHFAAPTDRAGNELPDAPVVL